MNVVSIQHLQDDKESLAPALAATLGVTVYEALARLRAPGNGPLIVAVFADEGLAEQLAARLRSAGLGSEVLSAREIDSEGNPHIVRKFRLGEDRLDVTTEKGEVLGVAFPGVDLILRGTSIFREVTTETVKGRSFSPGRAVLSGGLMITRTTKKVVEVTTDERRGFVNLYAKDFLLVFRENSLVYDSLGPALKPTRAANFAHLVGELRRRCPDALYDGRLLTRPGQIALLGPSLDPERNLAVATALLAKVLRAR